MNKLIFLSLFFGFSAFAEIKPQVDFCEPEIYKNLKDTNSLAQWNFIPPIHPDDKVYRTPTKQIGKWVELKIKKSEIIVIHFTANEAFSWSFSKQNCKPTQVKETKTMAELDAKGFNDKDLEKIITEKNKTMIYIWDPAAFHSVNSYLIYKTEAQKRGYKVLSLLAPTADEKWANEEIKSKKLDLNKQRLSSIELIMRGGNLHYPSVFFIKDGKISKRLMGGLEKNNISRFFDTFTKDL